MDRIAGDPEMGSRVGLALLAVAEPLPCIVASDRFEDTDERGCMRLS